MNTIGRIRFDFNMQNEVFAQQLYADWDSFFATSFEKVADEVLVRFDTSGNVLEIEHLELNLGTLTEENFYEKFPERVRKALEDVLSGCVHTGVQPDGTPVKRTSVEQNEFRLLVWFLLNGSLPWDTPGHLKDIQQLFLNVLLNDAVRFKQFLFTYGHYTSLQERLVYQLDDPELEEGVRLVAPGTAGFICNYVRFLRHQYGRIEQPGVNEADYRNTVWFIIYAWLLNNRSSYFNKKSFITQTILRLAARYNMGYAHLLELITAELEKVTGQLFVTTELFRILSELRQELSEDRLSGVTGDTSRFCRLILSHLEDMRSGSLPDVTQERLVTILSHDDSCRLFLYSLREDEVIRLLPLLIPGESEFVIRTARALDNQKEQGALQGKAGGEFRMLKWQLLFPVLLERKGVAFNRKYFVHRLVQRVAARYNLEASELLAYFISVPETVTWLDNNLRMLFNELYRELEPQPKQTDQGTSESAFTQLLEAFRLQKTLTSTQQKQVKKALSNTSFRRKLLEHIPASGYPELARLLFSEEEPFIVAYVRQLNLLHTDGPLEGRSGGEFGQLKWNFILTAWSEMPVDSFNRHYFVRQVLQKLAAHYNQNYIDLLVYFRQESMSMHVPFYLCTLFNKLFDEEKEHWFRLMLTSSGEASKLKLAKVLYPDDYFFIEQYIRTLDWVSARNSTSILPTGNFQEIKWRAFFEILLESRQKGFNKKQFIRQSLQKIAARYNLPIDRLVVWLNEGLEQLSGREFKETKTIIKELFNELKSNDMDTQRNVGEMPADLYKWLQKGASQKDQFLLDEFARHTDFINYATDELRFFFKLYDRVSPEITSLNRWNLLVYLMHLSLTYQSYSRVGLMHKLIEWMTAAMDYQQKHTFQEMINKWDDPDPLLYLVKSDISKGEEEPKKNNPTAGNPLFINNSGLVILSPYLPRLFRMLELINNDNDFKNKEARIRAIGLMHYATYIDKEVSEHELAFNKLLVDLPQNEAIPRKFELSEREKNTVDELLQAVLKNWPKLSRSSVTALREAFLCRAGKIVEDDDKYTLIVEQKAYDLLLDSIPWNYQMIRLPWMKKRVEVKWR